ncbi:hypothetical protein K2173_006733 [Erythroxylum novogranatense]|uniref:60S ribosomal protein L18a-like protein n=1 Tax=Erythroxylum novogranatense TaxID=1862640 RepID=A0AAV8T6Y9_9ROSI|nr:hypothetical protein K2173_006733 [Erythroxylum novogranatense]
MAEDGKSRDLMTGNSQGQNYYGTFQGVANHYPPPPPPQVVGFPQPVVPPGATSTLQYYPHGYQTIATGYAVRDTRPPPREGRLPFCGIGVGWFLFFFGFFLGGIPWYVGAFVLLCVRVDYREKPGYVACTIASILALIAVTLGLSKGAHSW